MASVNGIQIHYVIGSQGDPIVLLHGWPQTWYVLPIISLLFCFMDSIMHIRHRALGMEAKIFVILAFKIFSLASKV
jgi:pimeloyl-ACP methyl ester carboxylesterase